MDTQSAAKQAKMMLGHFRAFEKIKEVIDTVLQSENILQKNKNEVIKLKTEKSSLVVSIGHAEERLSVIVADYDDRSTKLAKAYEDQLKTLEETISNKELEFDELISSAEEKLANIQKEYRDTESELSGMISTKQTELDEIHGKLNILRERLA